LDAAGRFARTDMTYAARGGFWLTLGSALSSLSSFALAVGFANLVPKETYGTYKYALSLSGVLGAFMLTGFGEALTQAVARGFEGTLRTAFRYNLKWNAVASFGALAGAGWYFLNGNRTLGLALTAIAVCTPVMNSAALYSAFLKGKKDFRGVTAYGLVRTILPVAVLFAVLPFVDDAAAFVALYLLASVIAVLAAYAWTLRRHRPNDLQDPSAIAYGRHLSLMNVFGALVAYADKIIIFQFLGAAEVAVYALAQAIPEHLDALFINVRTLALPKFSTGDPVLIAREVRRKCLLIFLGLLPVVGAYALLAPAFFRIFFPRYMEAVPYSVALAAALLVLGPSQLLMAFVTARKGVMERIVLGPVLALPWLILMILLTPRYGLWGLVAAKLITKSSGLPLLLWFTKRIAAREAATRAAT
jgi:O-antigen/teichoic acid export membrane protein